MKNLLYKIWRWVRWPLGVLLVLYAGIVIWAMFKIDERERTAKVVAEIHAQKITLADVMGTNLPPAPNMQENNATVAGIDKNNNGVRDDVELAIFRNYPNSAKIRAAELQYALGIQLMITEVFNTETWLAAVKEGSRSAACIGETVSNNDLRVYSFRTEEIKNLVLNTSLRKDAWEKAYDFTTSHGDLSNEPCDISLNTLQD